MFIPSHDRSLPVARHTRLTRSVRVAPLARAVSIALVATVGCADAPATGEAGTAEGADMGAAMQSSNRIIELLASGEAVFGIFSGDHTPEQGALMAANRETDFVFYSLEQGPFDIPAMSAYMEAMAEAAGAAGARPVALRIPPVRDDRAAVTGRVAQGLGAGVGALVFPHVESPDDVAVAADAIGDALWPENPDGRVASIVLIEDRSGIARAREIVGAPGVTVAIPGPGDLRRAYEGDMEAVENAIQTVLAACLELNVPCGITAGVDDIADRLAQGFRLIIVTQPEALAVGRAAAGRTEDS